MSCETQACENYLCLWDSLVVQGKRTHLPTQETWVQSLGCEDALVMEKATHPSILTWETPWTREPLWLQSMGSQKATTTTNYSILNTLAY